MIGFTDSNIVAKSKNSIQKIARDFTKIRTTKYNFCARAYVAGFLLSI